MKELKFAVELGEIFNDKYDGVAPDLWGENCEMDRDEMFDTLCDLLHNNFPEEYPIEIQNFWMDLSRDQKIEYKPIILIYSHYEVGGEGF